MSDFIQKKDYWAISLMMGIFMMTYIFSKEFFNNEIFLVLPISGFGAMAGYMLANWATKKSTRLKLFLVLFLTGIFIGGIFIINRGQNNNNKPNFSNVENSLEGIWETDEEEGFKIRLEINGEEALMSMSPNFEEIRYDLEFPENSMVFKKAERVKFDFTIENIDDISLTLNQSGEKLVFTKLN
jgi:hypothetical protein